MGISFRRLCTATLANGKMSAIAALETDFAKLAMLNTLYVFTDI
jgi:hypothetical protein